MPDDPTIAVVDDLYRAFEAGDHEQIRRCLADDVEWRQAGSAVPAAGRDLAGADALVARVVEAIERDFDGFTEEVEHRYVADGHVIATGTYRGRHRGTGRRLEAEFCHVWRVRDGRITGFRQYTDTAAFAAATTD